jgi:hypothetical protein
MLWFATYGHPDGAKARAVFKHDFNTGLVYRLADPDGSPPVLHVRGTRVYRCDNGKQLFMLRGPFVYTAREHPIGLEPYPWYHIRKCRDRPRPITHGGR